MTECDLSSIEGSDLSALGGDAIRADRRLAGRAPPPTEKE